MGHTPGPWSIKWTCNVFSGERLIANCGGYSSNRDSEKVQDENNANAALVAAAPDLLAALEESIQYSPFKGESEETPFLRRARAAIAKAKGIN